MHNIDEFSLPDILLPEPPDIDFVIKHATGTAVPTTDEVLAKYSDDQPRDDKGRFSNAGAAGAESATTQSQHEAAVKYHQERAFATDPKGESRASRAHSQAAGSHADAAAGKSSETARMASMVANSFDRGAEVSTEHGAYPKS